ncbi:MAG: restriction endonuclease subunit S [Methylococcales bacterium]|nr:restriction endonuclease subunit S [Methylococcales bacterium]
MNATASSYPSALLGDVCRFIGGGTPSRKRDDYFNGNIPWATLKDFKTFRIFDTEDHISESGLADSASNLVPAGTVLLVTRVGLGKVAIAERSLAINQDIKAIIPAPEILPEFLFWFLLSKGSEIERMGAGATVKGVTLNDVRAIRMPLSPPAEQRLIVDILSRAEGIVRLRREAQKKAAEIIPALFIDMFGDPVTNPKGWEIKQFSLVGTLDRGKSRHRPRDAKELYGGPYPFIQTGDVANSGGRIKQYTATYSERGLAQSRLWPSGTLCITIAANIAKTGILEFDSCFPDSVVGFLPSNLVKTEYVQAWLGFLQPTLEKNAPQAAQKNINLEILRGLPVPVPPLALQDTFERRCLDISSIQTQQVTATQKSESVFNALLAGIFNGSALDSHQITQEKEP